MRCLNMFVMSSSFYMKARDYSGIQLMPPAAASKRGEGSGDYLPPRQGSPNPGREASRLPAPSADSCPPDRVPLLCERCVGKATPAHLSQSRGTLSGGQLS